MDISQLLTKLKTLVYSKNEIDTKLSAVVHSSGAEDVGGNKNFIDNLTHNGKNVEVIEEQGDNYIRYASGLQICWGEIRPVEPHSSTSINFPKAFFGRVYPLGFSASGQGCSYLLGWRETSMEVYVDASSVTSITYIAVGRWKEWS